MVQFRRGWGLESKRQHAERGSVSARKRVDGPKFDGELRRAGLACVVAGSDEHCAANGTVSDDEPRDSAAECLRARTVDEVQPFGRHNVDFAATVPKYQQLAQRLVVRRD